MKNVCARKMSTYRLTNVTHSEIAPCLPLPSLAIPCGATNPGLLFDGEDSATRLRGSNDAAALTQVDKIVELLKSTDVSYLFLKDERRHAASRLSGEEGGLVGAVLRSDPDAFGYASPSSGRRRSTRHSSTPNHIHRPDVSQAEGRAGSSSKAGHQFQPQFEDKVESVMSSPRDAPTSSRKTRMQRKHPVTSQRDEDSKNLPNAESDGVVGSLCEVLDELFERTDDPGEDEGEEAGTFLSLSEIKMMGEFIVNLRSKNSLHLIPSKYFIKLLSLLDRQVQGAQGRDVDDDYSENSSVVMSALEAVHISLLIMTAPSMTKQVYKEEIIGRTIEFTRHHIVHSVFSAYDPAYRQAQRQTERKTDEDDDEDDDMFENGAVSAKKNRSREKGSKVKKVASSRISGSISNVYHKLCIILGLLKDLLSVECLLDSIVLQLTKTVLATLAVDNIQLLQLKAIGVACVVFDVYPQHRTMIFDEIISLLWKLPSSKRSLRAFQLQDEDQPNQIQMLTAILLQLVQCSVTLPKIDAQAADAVVESSAPEKPSTTVKCFEPAMEACTYFWKVVLQRWAAPKTEGADIKTVVENVVTDLLMTLNVPEFPASSLLLQVLCILLLGPVGIKAKDAVVRGGAIDLLGQIAARLKQDAVSCSQETLWILQGLIGKGNATEQEALTKTCVVCGEGKRNQVMPSCDGCHRWFHGDCVGVTGHDLLKRGWLCHCCMCKRQLASLRSDVSPQMVGGPSLPRNKKVEEGDSSKSGVVVQQILLNYLQEAAVSDGLAAYAHRFYLCQWYRDDAQGHANLQFYHSRSMSKAPLQDFGSANAPLSRNAIVRIARSLGQQRPLARGFDLLLVRLLTSLQENSSTPRAKALRAVSAMVEVCPDVLGDERVQRAVEGRFLDSAISVREAAMELVGRHIVSRPDFAVKYFEKIAERIMDTGVSVRKRVIKIIRDVCMSNTGFAKATDGCLRIISRIHDEESSIQDLVGKTFYELWFEEPSVQSTQYATGGSVVPLEIADRTQQLVDVLRSLPNNQAMVTIIKRCLALDFCPQGMRNAAISAGTLVAVRHRCELMCKCLLESILKAEETTAEDSEIRALPHIMALHAFCTVDPTLCAPASDPSRYALTLLPYLKTQADNRDAAQLLQSIVFVIDTVLPLLRRPPENLVAELERDLRQLIVRYSFLKVIYACIKCLCSLTKVAVKGVNSFEFLVRRFFKPLDALRKNGYTAAQKMSVLRSLFCLGVLVRFGSELIQSMGHSDISLEQILGLYRHFMVSEDIEVKAKALQAVGYVFIAKPDFMMEQEVGTILNASLSTHAESRIKMQILQNFSEYLLDVEEKMGSTESAPENGEKSVVGKAVPVAAGAGDSNICGGIIQLHWDQILETCLDRSFHVRHASLKVVEVVLRQGLVHPMTCIPQLIAMEVDFHEANSKLAHHLLMQLMEKYPSFFESRFGDGLQLSFLFIQSGAASLHSSNSATFPVDGNPSVEQGTAKTTAKIAKSGISRIYKLIRPSRVSRNKFLSSVIRKFDSAASGIPSSIPFLVYCAEVLSSLPFGLPDEPLYIVYSINRLVQVRGGVLEANMKAAISEGALGVVAKQVLGQMALQKELEGKEAYDINITEETVCPGPVEREDDTGGIPNDALEKLGVDCNSAMALALLLRLKRHLKIVYALNDARCQAFQPTEALKPGEIISRRESIKEFSTQELPIDPPTTVRQMLEQYQAFKRLLKEDAMDYSTYIANIPTRKRGRPPANNVEAGEPGQAKGHVQPTRTLRKKKPAAVIVDESVSESEDESSDDWEDRGKKRKRQAAPAVRGSGTRGRNGTVQSKYSS